MQVWSTAVTAKQFLFNSDVGVHILNLLDTEAKSNLKLVCRAARRYVNANLKSISFPSYGAVSVVHSPTPNEVGLALKVLIRLKLGCLEHLDLGKVYVNASNDIMSLADMHLPLLNSLSLALHPSELTTRYFGQQVTRNWPLVRKLELQYYGWENTGEVIKPILMAWPLTSLTLKTFVLREGVSEALAEASQSMLRGLKDLFIVRGTYKRYACKIDYAEPLHEGIKKKIIQPLSSIRLPSLTKFGLVEPGFPVHHTFNISQQLEYLYLCSVTLKRDAQQLSNELPMLKHFVLRSAFLDGPATVQLFRTADWPLLESLHFDATVELWMSERDMGVRLEWFDDFCAAISEKFSAQLKYLYVNGSLDSCDLILSSMHDWPCLETLAINDIYSESAAIALLCHPSRFPRLKVLKAEFSFSLGGDVHFNDVDFSRTEWPCLEELYLHHDGDWLFQDLIKMEMPRLKVLSLSDSYGLVYDGQEQRPDFEYNLHYVLSSLPWPNLETLRIYNYVHGADQAISNVKQMNPDMFPALKRLHMTLGERRYLHNDKPNALASDEDYASVVEATHHHFGRDDIVFEREYVDVNLYPTEEPFNDLWTPFVGEHDGSGPFFERYLF